MLLIPHKRRQNDITIFGGAPGKSGARGLRLTVDSASRAGDQGGLAGTYVVLAASIDSYSRRSVFAWR